MSRVSLQMYTMREHTKTLSDLNSTLEKLREIGFTTLQYSIPDTFDVNEVKKAFDDLGIANDSVYCPCLKIEERSAAILNQCELFETDYVRIDSIPKGLTSSAAGYKMFAHYLNASTAELKKHGKKLLYHFHAFEFIRFGNTTGIEVLLAESDPEVVQIIPDTHWIQAGGKSITDFLLQYADRYNYVHAKDFTIGEMGPTWESYPIKFAPVGEGNINWTPIVELCKKNNVKSYAIEQDNCYGRDPFDCVQSSFHYLKSTGVDD